MGRLNSATNQVDVRGAGLIRDRERACRFKRVSGCLRPAQLPASTNLRRSAPGRRRLHGRAAEDRRGGCSRYYGQPLDASKVITLAQKNYDGRRSRVPRSLERIVVGQLEISTRSSAGSPSPSAPTASPFLKTQFGGFILTRRPAVRDPSSLDLPPGVSTRSMGVSGWGCVVNTTVPEPRGRTRAINGTRTSLCLRLSAICCRDSRSWPRAGPPVIQFVLPLGTRSREYYRPEWKGRAVCLAGRQGLHQEGLEVLTFKP